MALNDALDPSSFDWWSPPSLAGLSPFLTLHSNISEFPHIAPEASLRDTFIFNMDLCQFLGWDYGRFELGLIQGSELGR